MPTASPSGRAGGRPRPAGPARWPALLEEGKLSTVDGLDTFPDTVHPDDVEPGTGQDRGRGQTDVPQPDDRDVDYFYFSSVSHESCMRL